MWRVVTRECPSEQGQSGWPRSDSPHAGGPSAGCEFLHGFPALSATFDDPNLVSCAGLAAVLALAERASVAALVAKQLALAGEAGSNADLEVTSLVAATVAGADCIDDMDLLRHGGMGRLFTGVRAASTLGIFLVAFSFGHVRQLDAVAARRDRRRPSRRREVLHHRPDEPRCRGDDRASTRTRGPRSATRTRSGTKPNTGWSPTPRSPRSPRFPFTAFTSRRQREQVTGRLIVRRVKRLNPGTHPAGQGQLPTTGRHHGVFTDTTLPLRPPTMATPSSSRPRRPARRPARPPTIRVVRRERCLVGAGRDRSQPHPRRRRDRLNLPRQGHHRHHPSAPDHLPARAARSVRRLVLHLPKDCPGKTPGRRCSPPPPWPPGTAST